jgi:predicted transcriptional regulator
MVAATVYLTEENKRRIEALAREAGKSEDEVVNEAVERMAFSVAPAGELEMPQWKAALMQAAGMWKDRDDIPGLIEQLRRELNRVEPSENP